MNPGPIRPAQPERPTLTLPIPTFEVGVQLASAVIHALEATSANGHDFDIVALRAAAEDPRVQAYFSELDALALLPVRR